ncbi:MAG: hypothetical protein ABIJ21_00565 [Nanoarchaeota archaeon]
MKYDLLVRKLNTIEEKYITSDKIEEYCSIVELEYYDAIIYLTRHKYLYTIFKGIFYKPSIAERKLKSIKIDHFEAVSAGLGIKGIKNWYFALETALKFNGMTHEFFAVDFIINDTICRVNPMTILGNKIKFIKTKPRLMNFGMKKTGHFKYSDVEKTVLDMIYLKRYDGIKGEAL